MTHLAVGQQILILVPVYAAAFFWAPSVLASYFDESGRPNHEVMQDFRIWRRQRIWVAAAGFGGCLLLPPLFMAEMLFPLSLGIGLMILLGVDVFQLRGMSRNGRNFR